MNQKKFESIHVLLIYCIIITIVSFIGAKDFYVWLFELGAGLIGVPVLLIMYYNYDFKFSNLTYILIGLHFTILAIGAHYTYAEMPLFNYLRDIGLFSRNQFDGVGHFMQGFVPAIIAREILIRKTQLEDNKMLFFLVICIALSIAAFWELLEMIFVIIFYPNSGPEWLGLQGDVWDSQKDMLMCLIGAITSYIIFRQIHNKSIEIIENEF